MNYRKLSELERDSLLNNRCRAADWSRVRVTNEFDARRVIQVEFVGDVRIGRLSGVVTANGTEKPAGIYHATVVNTTIGNDARLSNIHVHVANYDIGDNACIEDLGSLITNPGARFGNGVQVDVLNEGGGREVILFNELSSQFAYLVCLHRYQPEVVKKLTDIAHTYANSQQSHRGKIGKSVTICSVDEIVDVNVGEGATIRGTSRLCNGTILSAKDAPTFVGADVQAEDFVFAEGANVTSGATLTACFVGQGCQLGRQFSAENSLFFANCEGFHGEAVSLFAGPYSVTHHKSTLLIAGLLSFYNAGSGTNQSNHMYKLGPVHEGKLERGCKTGSFSYMMWPCCVGPFSVVLGKHKRHFDTRDFPFALIEANAQGHCTMVPGLNLTTVGTVRDGAKWPARDRRKGSLKRDRITFDVLSPYTVGRMIRGSKILKQLQEETEKSVESVTINGAVVKRVLLRTAQKFYRTGIELYLLEQIVKRAEHALNARCPVAEAFDTADTAVYSEDWLDICGLLMPRKRLDALTDSIRQEGITDIDGFFAALDQIGDNHADDAWVWTRHAYEQLFGRDPVSLTTDELLALSDKFAAVKSKFLKQVLADAEKEFEDKTGYGHGGTADQVDDDFASVRGEYQENSFVRQLQQDLVCLETRIAEFQTQVRGQSMPL